MRRGSVWISPLDVRNRCGSSWPLDSPAYVLPPSPVHGSRPGTPAASRESLRSEDKAVFADLLDQGRLYASLSGTMPSPVKELPLIISMLFGQHKRLIGLEKRINHFTGRDAE